MSTINNVKKRGRPSIDSEAITVRMERELIERVDRWRDNALGQPTRPEAIRRLVERGLGD
jgi:hypothetical protein